MKTISVDINDDDLKELGISEEHISIEELKKQILIQSIRRQREVLQKINKEYGLDLLSEEEILKEVNEAKSKYRKGKNTNGP